LLKKAFDFAPVALRSARTENFNKLLDALHRARAEPDQAVVDPLGGEFFRQSFRA